MGIKCELKIHKSAEGGLNPGSPISGIIKYTLQQETAFKKITVSFKGYGYLILKHKRRENNMYTQRRREDYVDIDYVIHMSEKEHKLAAVTYETEFNFVLPENIPPSLRYSTRRLKYLIQCSIVYYIRIKFDMFGLTKAPRKFRREVKVFSTVKPKLPMEPTVYGEQKTLTMRTLFYRQKGVVNIKAVIDKSVLAPGEKVIIDCDVTNDSNVTIRGVITRIIEVYNFKSKCDGEVLTLNEYVESTSSRTNAIFTGESQNTVTEITLPPDIFSIEDCDLVTREYHVLILAELPRKRCAFLRIPIQIGDEVKEEESLPSYWEAMQEQQVFYQSQRSYESSDGSGEWI